MESTNFAPIPYTRKTKHDYALVLVPYSKCILAQIRVKLWTTLVGTVKHFTTFACFRHEAKKRSQGLLGKMTNKKVFLVPRKWFAPFARSQENVFFFSTTNGSNQELVYFNQHLHLTNLFTNMH